MSFSESKMVLMSSGEAEALIMRVSPKSGYWRGSYELMVEIDLSVIAVAGNVNSVISYEGIYITTTTGTPWRYEVGMQNRYFL